MLWATGDNVQAYFDRLSAVPPEAIAYFLYNLDLSAMDKTFPHTAYERMQKEMAMSAIQVWWASVLKNKRFSNLYKLSDTAEIKVPTQVLQKSFDLWWSTHSTDQTAIGNRRSRIVGKEIVAFTGVQYNENCRCTEAVRPQQAHETKAQYDERSKKQFRATLIPSYPVLVKQWKKLFKDDAFTVGVAEEGVSEDVLEISEIDRDNVEDDWGE